MIGRLRGTVASIGEDTLVLDVGGVGYDVSATPRLLSRLTEGQPVTLSIETLVAETYIRLIGFESDTERRCFRLLQSVQGVGAKAALSILHVLPPEALLDAIAMEDKTAVARAQGVGPKLAQRVVSELKGKTGNVLSVGDFRPASRAAITAPNASDERRDAISALISLGYDDVTARKAVGNVDVAADETASSLITAALKGLSTP